MRIRIFSDVHLEFEDWHPPKVAADVVVIAGDLHVKRRGFAWIREHFRDVPVVYIAGNHEFYGSLLPDEVGWLRQEAAAAGVNYLENQAVEIGGTVFLGCTLWTDFRLLGDPGIAGPVAASLLNDYRQIRTAPQYRRLKGRETAASHAASRVWLQTSLKEFAGKPIVVVTHHAPSARSIHPDSAGELVSAAYASALGPLVETSGAALWIHGHTHHSVDYDIGQTRVVANQRGYPDQFGTGFIPDLVINI